MRIKVKGHTPTSRQRSKTWPRLKFNIPLKHLPAVGGRDRIRARLYQKIHTLLEAGLDLGATLDLLVESERKVSILNLLQTIRDQVVSGQSLSQALQQTGFFGNYECFSIRIGEESGTLDMVTRELANYYQRKLKLKQQLTGALLYPTFVLATAIGVVAFMLAFVVPMFSGVYQRMGGELPDITKRVIASSEWVSSYWQMLALAIAGIVLLAFTQRKTNAWRSLSSQLVLRVPFFGNMISLLYLARFCQSMYTLLSARTPLVEALALVQQMIGFYPLEVALSVIRENILKGQSLHEAMQPFGIFPQQMVSLIKVAEEVNRLDTMFGKLAGQYAEEGEHQTSTMGSVIEPIMILFIAGFVGLILVAMYLPMFRMGGAIG